MNATKPLLFLALLISFRSLAQESLTPAIHAFHISNLPPEGVLLDKDWKFQTGDKPDYAKPDFDDSKWPFINPIIDIHELPQKKGIIWFRLHLFLDSNLLKEQLALIIEQSGASEIYLNGSLIHRFGVLDPDPEKIKAFDPLGGPVVFPVKNGGQQILAVRYGVQPDLRYTSIFASRNYVLKTAINTMETANQDYFRGISVLRGQWFSSIGIFFIFTILHLSFFLFYPSQKANLYFSLFALFNIVGNIMALVYLNNPWVEHKVYSFNLVAELIFIGNLFMVTALYYLLNQKRGKWYFGLIIFSLLWIAAFALPGYWGWNIGSVLLINMVNLEISRISFIAVKKKKRGAWIIAAGCLCCLLSWVGFLTAGNPGGADAFTIIVFNLAFFSIPVSASIYLGIDFAFTNRLLGQKLIEVEDLSQKTIAQEKEKRQILADQNETLEKQVTERTTELNQSLQNLRSTQAQLIQSEKMASLGELTAGIAHEIQNPLNFVNNFSDVNTELVDELKTELATGNTQSAIEIADNIKENEQKINHHGKRADAIVKGMLQHSRTSSGQKELTDINALADEYLRLAYHGLRAKDNSFNATIKTDFDESIGNINIIPQDIGRVILNLINNAFYAVDEKKKSPHPLKGGEEYEPLVTVSTKRLGSPPTGGDGGKPDSYRVEIRVADNGNGVPQKVLDKIFQPFFTTKPTGQGTGLGLSLSYDIVKVHGGEIKIVTTENVGTEFIIQL